MEFLLLAIGASAGALFAIIFTKDRWVHPDTLREAHWAQDEKNRWEVRTGRHLNFDEVSDLRAQNQSKGE